jgi:hypothetical protein
MTPRRLFPDDPALAQVLPLVRRAFAEHEGVIDPPSSLHRMTDHDVGRLAAEGEVWGTGEPLAACVSSSAATTRSMRGASRWTRAIAAGASRARSCAWPRRARAC